MANRILIVIVVAVALVGTCGASVQCNNVIAADQMLIKAVLGNQPTIDQIKATPQQKLVIQQMLAQGEDVGYYMRKHRIKVATMTKSTSGTKTLMVESDGTDGMHVIEYLNEGTIIISFQPTGGGANPGKQFWANMNVFKTKENYADGLVQAVKHFTKRFDELVTKEVFFLRMPNNNRITKVLIVGLSRGGALAEAFASHWQYVVRPYVVTLNSPMAGNAELCKTIRRVAREVVKFRTIEDTISSAPFPTSFAQCCTKCVVIDHGAWTYHNNNPDAAFPPGAFDLLKIPAAFRGHNAWLSWAGTNLRPCVANADLSALQ